MQERETPTSAENRSYIFYKIGGHHIKRSIFIDLSATGEGLQTDKPTDPEKILNDIKQLSNGVSRVRVPKRRRSGG